MNTKICIVGSANIDQISYVDTIPSDGETVFGDSYQMGFGGRFSVETRTKVTVLVPSTKFYSTQNLKLESKHSPNIRWW